MQLEVFRKKLFRAISCVFIVVIFFTEVVLSKDQTLTRIQQYLSNMKTFQANFYQTNDTGDIMTGKFYLKKPGRIRFSYDYPHNVQIVSKQQALLIFDPMSSGSGPLTYPLSSTPLGYLIRNEFSGMINENAKSFEQGDKMFMQIQNSQYRVSIEFKKNPVSLVGWEFENQMGEIITISLDNIQTNNFISNEIFKTEKDYNMIKK